ncbi:ADP-ribosylglycohydrolase family protein [Thermoanaerobacterium sp. RBIITD]|uniref:ADP-ribosylglycohydrolase family protein n=1 Tax=Thermoanaerobacterium sp. RBIITD TaxID=1550240 RepID=UPI000BB93E84|nr:ADP-ribosylglycohydrolase family protein [Thermoanaerobacterium sp. RBIITD]SNX54055.1 ADP-ribosyl-[dinitrogen reductase] hydrolase [Thermoanaerobacterium sp. RBIITD]
MINNITDKIYGAFYGVAIGDALGATVEHERKENIVSKYGVLKDIIGGGWLNLKPGEWTDDTEMTLAVAEGIIENKADPVPKIGEHFLRWAATNPYDIGGTVKTAIRSMWIYNLSNYEWEIAAKKAHEWLDGKSAGNGALMRTIPVGIVYKDEIDIIKRSVAIAKMTHFDPKAGLTCAIYSLMVHYILYGEKDKLRVLNKSINFISESIVVNDEITKIFEDIIEINKNDLIPNGYTINTLKCALWAFLESENPEQAIINAVNLGGDADTIGAIAGGLAGVYWGYKEIPKRWVKKLRNKKKLNKICKSILKYV